MYVSVVPSALLPCLAFPLLFPPLDPVRLEKTKAHARRPPTVLPFSPLSRVFCDRKRYSQNVKVVGYAVPLRDRVRQWHFRIVFVPGLSNDADFFTKTLPIARHRTLAPFSAFDPDDDDDATTFSSTLNFSSMLFVAF